MKFPFRVGVDGVETSSRSEHVREQIDQVLFTTPGERVFRPDFGVGLRAMVFEPNDSLLATVVHKRITTSLAEALKGEVDPKTIQIEVDQDDSVLAITVRYQLSTMGYQEEIKTQYELGDASGMGG